MSLAQKLRGWRRADRGWPRYMPGGRVRTSTAGLVVAFFALFWLYQSYEPPPPAPAPAMDSAVVPPGFVPDPDYTWVPRTNVRPREPEYTTTTRPPTTTSTVTPTTAPTTTSEEPTTTTSPGQPVLPFGPSTTVIDPDGIGPQGPQTFTEEPSSPSSAPSLTVAPPVFAPTATPPGP